MGSDVESTFDVLVLFGSTAYTVTALCGVSAMWTLRRQFFIALRSPLLGCLIGATGTIRSCLAVYYFLLLHDWSSNPRDFDTVYACFRIVFTPATLVALVAMIAWVVRILILYDPTKRKKWGRYTNEKRIFRALVWTYVLIEVAAWASAYALGAVRTASLVSTLDILSTVALLIAAVLLTGKLRRVHDICRLSTDTQLIGALMVCKMVVVVLASSLRLPRLLRKCMKIYVAVSAQPITWIINVRPVRDYVRHHDHPDVRAGTLLLLLLLPWEWLWRRLTCGKGSGPTNSYGSVACTSTYKGASMATQSEFRSSGYDHLQGLQLEAVMEFLPLKQAFEEYCRKALCSESFQFLVDVSDFQALVRAHGAGEASVASEKDEFDAFTAIVNEYIKDNSNSEINIDSSTKKKIMGFCERSVFASLVLEDRENIFLPAEREIAKMLAENLLEKFKATKEYKELVGDTFLEAGK